MSTTDRRGAPSPAGTVAVTFSSESARFASLFRDLNNLEITPGTVKIFESGPKRHVVLNRLVDQMLENGSYWIWFISEDHGFEPGIVQRLISLDEPMVSPVVVDDHAPFFPRAWTSKETPLLLNQVTGPTTLIEVEGATVTGMLVRRAVFESMVPPWFRVSDELSEDAYFCERAREMGFQIYVDTSSRLSTMSVASVSPTHKGGQWELAVDVGDDISVSLPIRHR
jgi:hypothetical protein